MNPEMFFDFSKYFNSDVNAILSKRGQLSNNSPDRVLNCLKAVGLADDMKAIPGQIHSNIVKNIFCSGFYKNTDGLVSFSSNIVLTLSVADCVPVFLYDISKKGIALIHSGWRGTAKNIVGHAVKKFIELGSSPNSIIAVLGPSICSNCYEVGEDTANQFDETEIFKIQSDKWLLDLKFAIKKQLSRLHVPIKNIIISDICTFESKECESYRKHGVSAGRLTALMWMDH